MHAPIEAIYLSSRPVGLWSLWDMINHWGYLYLLVGCDLAYIETGLEEHLRNAGTTKGLGPSTLDPNGALAGLLGEKCQTILRLCEPVHEELGAIPANIGKLQAKLALARRSDEPPSAKEILDDTRRLKNDFLSVLSERWFYYLRADAEKYYGRVAMFGEEFWEKFKDARDDLERAGNCLALGEGTASVMHLMRMMESIIRHLGNQLNITINPKDTWGGILNTLDGAIKLKPETTHDEKRIKDQWSECRNYLWHVKRAHRDDSMHGKRTYTPTEAEQVLKAIKDFADVLMALV
jgi:hypothetical protein